MNLNLSKRDRGLLITALGIGIEKQYAAIENCRDGWERSGAIREAVKQHEYVLAEFERVRELLLESQREDPPEPSAATIAQRRQLQRN